MRLLAATVMDVSIVLLVALATAAALRRHSAALRHWILTVAIVCALAAPLLELGLPAWRLPAGTSRWAPPSSRLGRLPCSSRLSRTDGRYSQRRRRLAAGRPMSRHSRSCCSRRGYSRSGCALVAAGAIGALAAAFARVGPLTIPGWEGLLQAMARAHGVSRRVDLVRSPNPAMVVTWGLFRPRIVVPTCTWTDARIRVVLSHELAHVRRNDWAVQLAASVLQCLYWFHPLVWLSARSLRREADAHATTWCSKQASPDPITPVTCSRSLAPHRRCGPGRRPRRWPGLPRLKRGFAPC